jgi:hypothetical protein
MEPPDWSAIRALRDAQLKGGRDEPAEARRLLARLDQPPPAGVSEEEIPDLIRTVLKAHAVGPNPKPGLATDAEAAKQAEKAGKAGGGGLAKAAADLGSHNPKGVDANANGVGVFPEPATQTADPPWAAHGGNSRHGRPLAGVVGNSARSAGYKLLTFTFYDDRGRLRQVIEEMADPDSPVRRTLEELGISGEDMSAAAETYRQRKAEGSFPGEPNSRHKQIQFPLPDGGYHALTPIPNASLHRELMARSQQRRAERQAEDGTYRWDRIFQRDWAVGGTKPQNAGLLASWTAAMPSLLAEPPSPMRGTDPDILREVERAGTLFPQWLLRRLHRTGADEALRRAQAAVTEHLNVHTRARRQRAASEVAREVLSLADRFRWLTASELGQGLAAIPPDERALFAGRREEIPEDERPDIPTGPDVRARLEERALDLIKGLRDLQYDQALETVFREALAREMEAL